ncbi:MFS transporter [Flavihumibacter petaseus]|uniref:Putative major facilitator superfamily transporter n=1 Tax=Flavihumibacter petaseus NBRC 106054 TaxID=1220578 RepID=A0A0E9N4E9_9BACT|nr:MFS transporter [Flavihumibacter petaseus]GAO44852.1 putative major facilitator superfamily transporter [Flavihumibacter petaseus NBRC 106054]
MTLKNHENSGSIRWFICTLVFLATTINYLDRAVISLLKPTLEKAYNWSETDYSRIVTAFQLSYAIGLLLAGRVIDKIGTKSGYALSLTLWSVAAIGHAFVVSTGGFILARTALGISEAGNFPAAIKTVAEWFPKAERSFATGFFNSGTALGAILAPLTVPFIEVRLGWQWAFILTGAVGLLWLVLWFRAFSKPETHPRISAAELAYIQSDTDEVVKGAGETEEPVKWVSLLRYRQTWAYVCGKFFTDPVWWFYLFWLPAFLKAQYGLEKTDLALPVATVYILSAIGSVVGGWLPYSLIRSGMPVFRSRKLAMFGYALCALPVMAAQWLGSFNMWWAVLIIGFGAAAHQAWSANIYTTVSDMFPKKAVASVTGIGGMAGALGGMLIAVLAGALFDHYKILGNLPKGYAIMFFICGFAYLFTWLLMHLLAPRMKRIDL